MQDTGFDSESERQRFIDAMVSGLASYAAICAQVGRAAEDCTRKIIILKAAHRDLDARISQKHPKK